MSEEKNMSPAQSPVQRPRARKEIELFDFFTALKMIVRGKRVSKKEWNNVNVYGVLRNEILTLHKEDGDHSWIISAGDFAGRDWFVL